MMHVMRMKCFQGPLRDLNLLIQRGNKTMIALISSRITNASWAYNGINKNVSSVTMIPLGLTREVTK